ncbi:hypothetical protein BASA82_000681 [Batrachochytrium salamandrivorans]|nr:hypothetical protein BASA82_000681 [Batrachochytrium salamandrivorans]
MIPLERTMSGVFHDTNRLTPGQELRSIPSRMSMDERREFHQTHEPDWVLKGSSPKGSSAVVQALKYASKGFALSFAGRAAWTLLFSYLLSKSKAKPSLRASLADTLQFAGFFSGYTAVLHGVNALLVNARGVDDRWNAAASGFLAGLALLLDRDVERRRIIAIYVAVRATSVLVKALARERVLPVIPQFESMMFGLINMPIMYGLLLEPDMLDPGYYKWILGMGDITHSGLETTLRLRFKDPSLPFCTCQPHYHTGSCTGYCVRDWFAGLGRASKIYAPVHILPLLIFRFAKLRAEPQKQFVQTAKALALSSMFLTTYQFNVKYSQCMLRNARLKDDLFNATVGGGLTGLACLFETPSRVSELMLYCVPKALEVVWNYGVKYHHWKTVPYFELVLFTLGNAVLVSALKEDLKSTYFNALAFVVTGEFRSHHDELKKKKTKEEEED